MQRDAGFQRALRTGIAHRGCKMQTPGKPRAYLRGGTGSAAAHAACACLSVCRAAGAAAVSCRCVRTCAFAGGAGASPCEGVVSTQARSDAARK